MACLMRPKITLALLLLVVGVTALIHEDIRFEKDDRASVYIEKFGLIIGGHYNVTATNITVWDADGKKIRVEDWNKPDKPPNYGLLFKLSRDDVMPSQDVGPGMACPLNPKVAEKYHIKNERPMPFATERLSVAHDIAEPGEEGIYQLFFINCAASTEHTRVSFNLHAEFYHVMEHDVINHLQAGEFPLPTIYLAIFLISTCLIIMWTMSYLVPLLQGKQGYATQQNNNVKRLQVLLTVLFIFKALSLLCRAIEYHYIKTTGEPKGWNIPFYVFTFVKGTMLFTVFLLIGTGWAFIKQYLSSRDKKLIIIVVPLQVLANIAFIIMDETSPSTRGWLGWRQLFQLVDLICSTAIIIPIFWSIKHLKAAQSTDGKAARIINKMRLFRQYYLTVVVYIYFTRFIILLLDYTLPFTVLWLAPLFSELATLIFFCITGWNFRPTEDNNYFSVLPVDDSGEIQMETINGDDREIIGLED